MESQQLGPYVLIKRLGRGGMGAVYEAEHEGTGEHVAVKVLAPHLADDFGLKERFNAEIQTLKPLRCPGIVQLIAMAKTWSTIFFNGTVWPESRTTYTWWPYICCGRGNSLLH